MVSNQPRVPQLSKQDLIQLLLAQVSPTTHNSEVVLLSSLKHEILKFTAVNYTKSTNQIYFNTFKNFISILGDRPIHRISAKDIENYKTLRSKRVNKTTCNIEIRTIKAIFNQAIAWNMLSANPANSIKQFKIEESEILSFTPEEVLIILNSIGDKNFRDLVIFTLNTGLRVSEVINLQWKDISLAQKVITIRNKEGFKTKSGRIRKIPLNESLVQLVNQLTKDSKGIFKFFKPDEYVFVNKRKNRFERSFISRKFKEALRAHSFPEKYHFHCLRHTFITELIKRGVNINFVKEIAGHSDIKTTMNYVHIVTEDLRDAVNRINIGFGGEVHGA